MYVKNWGGSPGKSQEFRTKITCQLDAPNARSWQGLLQHRVARPYRKSVPDLTVKTGVEIRNAKDWLSHFWECVFFLLTIDYLARPPENFRGFLFAGLPGDFALKNAGDFWRIFSGLRFPRNEARKLLKKFWENSGRNSGQNSGRKFEKFGKLSFCDFSDLTIEVFLLTVRLFYLRWGNRKRKIPNPISERGEP